MKICFLASSATIHSYKWINYFHKLGHEITWISLAPRAYEIPEGIRFFEVPLENKVMDLPRAVVKIRKVISNFNPDLLHIHYVGIYGLVGLFSGADTIVATPWGSDVVEGKKFFWKRPIIRRILNRAKLVTCDAQHMRDEVINLGVPSERIRIVNFGIDTNHFSKGPQNMEVRRGFGLNSEPAVLSLRNFEPVYDVATLIKSVPRVLATVPDARFIVVGRGSLEEELKSLAVQLGVCHAVNFVGFIPNEQLPVIMSNTDVYVSTSLLDAGIAASTAEAMACELPVVVTDTGENSRWINSGENGVLVPVGQPDILAEQLIQLLQNAELRHEFGKRGRATICENNEYHVEMAKMESVYQEIGVQ